MKKEKVQHALWENGVDVREFEKLDLAKAELLRITKEHRSVRCTSTVISS